MPKSSGKCGCIKCGRRKRKKRIESDLIAEMAYQHRVSKEEMPPTEENKKNLEIGQSQHLDCIKLQQTDLTERAWWNDMNHRVYMPPLMLQNSSSKPTRSECSSVSSGFKTAQPETPNPPSSSSSVISDTSDYKSCNNSIFYQNLRSISSKEIAEKYKTIPELPVRTKSQPLGHPPKELRELHMIASRRKKKRPVCRTTSHATDSFSNCVKCSKIVSRPFRKINHRLNANYFTTIIHNK